MDAPTGSPAKAADDLKSWVAAVAARTRPSHVHWCDGSDAEYRRLTEAMVADGTLIPLHERKQPGSYLHRSDPSDVARLEDRTFICSENEADAGPLNNWKSPAEMKAILDPLFEGCMRGRTMYVVPYVMGPPGGDAAKVGVEITDSPYVAANMRIMTRMGRVALEELARKGHFTKGLHSTGDLSKENRYIAHFPDEDLIMSFSSNYGGNALLGKKCHALRLASVQARNEGWLAEHMLIVGVTNPQGETTYIAGAFPSACGKTNLAMLVPPVADRAQGWSVETVGDDIAWLRFGEDGRLWAVNPEHGFFGVAPGTSEETNRNALASCRANTLFTNVALKPDRTVWWEGLEPAPPECIDWLGQPWTPDSDHPAAHPNSRFTAPAGQCPSISDRWEDPQGVPIDAIVFGGRRSRVMPLAFEAFDWEHGTYLGATMSSEKTAAAEGTVGELRFDPMAMRPFCGYHIADYWRHWLEMGRKGNAGGGDKMPKVFHVNWFRRGEDGRFLWPGFGDNMRVLEWIVDRVQGAGDAVETPLGYRPTREELHMDDLGVSAEDEEALFAVNRDDWRAECDQRDAWFDLCGDRLPPELRQQNDALRERLG
ncbi:phosphoenolpyruvate carboxykinase (GTP) [Alienimonas californiensis]|nr:phosphoenolpyruvate carboxykinase (GTP) [Alienimonas californiensis]